MIKFAVCALLTAIASLAVSQGTPDVMKYFAGHRGEILAIATSPVGAAMAVAQENGPINLFDTDTREMTSAIDGSAKVLRFSPDGTKLIGGSRLGFDIWDTQTGDRIRQIPIPNPLTTVIRAGAISVDANYVAAFISDNTAVIWNTSDGSIAQSFTTSIYLPTSASFDADGDTLAAGHHTGLITRFDWAMGVIVDEIEAHNGPVNGISFHNDTMVSAGHDHLLKTWNANTGTLIRTFTGHYNPVWTAKISGDGQRIVSGCSRRVILWNANTGGIRGMYSNQFRFRAAEFTADGTEIIAGNDIHDVFARETDGFHFLKNYSDHKAPVTAVTVSDDGTFFASGGIEPRVRLWRGNDLYREIYTFNYANSIDIILDNSKVLFSGGRASSVYDAATGNFVGGIMHDGVASDSQFSEDSRYYYSVSTLGDVYKETANGHFIWVAYLRRQALYVAVPNADRGYICVATVHTTPTMASTQMHVLNAQNGNVIRSWEAHIGYITGLEFRKNGDLVAAFLDGRVSAWNSETGALLWTIKRPAGIRCFDVSSAGDVGVTGGVGELRFFKMSNGEELTHYDREIFYQVDSVAMSPDERWYVYGMDSGTVAKAKSPLAVDLASATLVRGNTISGGPASLTESDEDIWRITPGVVPSSSQPPVEIVLKGTSMTATPSRLKFRAVVSASSASMTQKIEFYDYTTNQWVVMDTRTSSPTETGIDVQITDDPQRFVHPTSREIQARLTMRQTMPTLGYPWQARLNQAFWIVVP